MSSDQLSSILNEPTIEYNEANCFEVYMKINIIGDIAGRFDELQELLSKMPEADLILSVGDMMDRGPKSREVLQWFMEQQMLGKAETIYGNHEELMVQGVKFGASHMWFYNGGTATIRSYADSPDQELEDVLIDADHIEWLEKRPMYFQTDDLFVSHAPITSLKYVPKDPYSRDHYFIWNRYEPSKPMDKFVVNGHNGLLTEYKWGDGSVIGMCIDNSHRGQLCGMHWPSKEIFAVDYSERKAVSPSKGPLYKMDDDF